MAELQIGAVIETVGKRKVKIVKLLGDGGQGWVYQVDYAGAPKALKWYKPGKIKNPQQFYKNIKNNIDRGAPSNSFLWPEDLTVQMTDAAGNLCFGYIMDLRPSRFVDFSDFLRPKPGSKMPVNFKSTSAMIQCALNVVSSFRELHNAGYTYQDLNDGNFFIDPATGEVLICDNDNVSEEGFDSGIAGKSRYMAPPIVMGTDPDVTKRKPNKQSDRFSMAVVLFLMLFRNHPLEGAAYCKQPVLTEQVQKLIYGKNPVFLYDPTDSTNRPVQGIHKNVIRIWNYYPKYVQDIFVRAFDKEVMHQRKLAPIDKDWLKVFITLRAYNVNCACGAQNLLRNVSGEACFGCKRSLTPSAWFKTADFCVPVYPGAKVYSCYFGNLDDFTSVSAEVIQSKSNAAIWGLRNVSNDTWVYTMPDGSTKMVAPNEVAQLLVGAKMSVRGVEGTIVAQCC